MAEIQVTVQFSGAPSDAEIATLTAALAGHLVPVPPNETDMERGEHPLAVGQVVLNLRLDADDPDTLAERARDVVGAALEESGFSPAVAHIVHPPRP